MKRSKDRYYMKQIFECIFSGEVIATGKISSEVGLSEKSVRNKLNEINDFLLQHELGEIRRKPRVGIWLEASKEQKDEASKILSGKEGISINEYDPRERVTETLKILFSLRPWQMLNIQKLSERLYLSVPTMLKVIRECENWLSVYHIELVNERGKGYRLQCGENQYRIALKNLIMEKGNVEDIKRNIHFFFQYIDVEAISQCIIQVENQWNYHFTDESYYEILVYCCLAYKRKELDTPSIEDYYSEEFNILKKYNEYAFTVAIFEVLEEVFHVHFLSEDILFLSIQILCSKFIGISEVEITLEQVKKYDNQLVEFVDRMLKIIGDILDVNLASDQKVKESLIVHLRPTIFRLRYGTPQDNVLIDFIKKEYKNVFRASWAISILFEESYHLKITEDEIGYIVLYIQAALERKERQYNALIVTNSNMGHAQLIKERISKFIPEVGKLDFVSTHDYTDRDYDDYDVIVSSEKIKSSDYRVVIIPNILNEEGILVLRNHLNQLESLKNEKDNPFSPECCLLFSPELIFPNLKVKNKEECLAYMADAMYKKGVVKKDFYATVMDRESKTTTTIGNGISIPHGSPTAVNESKVSIAFLDEPIMWDGEQIQIIFLLGFKMSTRDEIHRIQLFYKEYVSLIDTEEKIKKLRSLKTNLEVYKYLIR